MRIIFMGNPEVAAITLEALIQAGKDIVVVVCSPDRPSGRKQKISFSAVKLVALKYRLNIYQPENINSVSGEEYLKTLGADLGIVVAYGRILASRILAIPKRGCFNLHYSLLPRWRGPAPIQFSLLNSDSVTGVSLIKMNAKMDQGPIVNQISCKIDPQMSFADLEARLSNLGIDLLSDFLQNKTQLNYSEQDHSQATYSRIVTKEDGRINWNKNADSIYAHWRAFNNHPGVYTFYQGQRFILRLIELDISEHSLEPGRICLHSKIFKVACACGFILVQSCQLPGRKILHSVDFLNGLSLEAKNDFFSGKFE